LRHLPVAALALGACAGSAAPGDTADTSETAEAALEHVFSFAIFADPHVVRVGDHLDRLRAAVAWANEHADARRIDVVFVVGDIGWSGGLPLAREALDDLVVPYVPVI